MKRFHTLVISILLFINFGYSQSPCRGNIVVWATTSNQQWKKDFLSKITNELEVELANANKPGVRVLARSQGYQIDKVVQNEKNQIWIDGLSEESKMELRKLSADIVLFSQARQDVQYGKYSIALNFVNISPSTNEKGTTIEFLDDDFQDETKRRKIMQKKLNELFECTPVELLIEETNTKIANKERELVEQTILEKQENIILDDIFKQREIVDAKRLKGEIRNRDYLKQIEDFTKRTNIIRGRLDNIKNKKTILSKDIDSLKSELKRLKNLPVAEVKHDIKPQPAPKTPDADATKPNCTEIIKPKCLNYNELTKICCEDFFKLHKGHYVQVMSTYNSIDECRLKDLFQKGLSPNVFLVTSSRSILAVYLGPFTNKIDADNCLRKIAHRYPNERPVIRTMINNSLCD